ncbi:Cof-type HAD-IIB family hydrolase [Mycoplasma simbae]|uniref:Cof-type HAD-IIB family hydrolase n=1 Tax=Mycoplasma simbae TaxID=36744 RepID=UPI000497C0B3|nr:Cof-type HAD-IIB family hydrolase [Mycoplasma simbae]
MNEQFKRIVFSDVDGTIYSFPEHKLENDVKESVLESKKEGVEFVIVTGNPLYDKIKFLARELNSRYVITSNGAQIYDILNDEYVYKQIISDENTQKIIKIVDKYDGSIAWHNETEFGLYNMSFEMSDFYKTFNDFDDYNLSKDAIKSVFKIEIAEPIDHIKKIYNELIKLDLDLDIVLLSTHIEITAKNVSKGDALLYACKNVFNTKPEYVMAIGDSENDLSMLKVAGFAYAMDNSSEIVKKSVSLYTSSVEQNGLGEAIVDYVYRTRLMQEKALIEQKINAQNAKLRR